MAPNINSELHLHTYACICLNSIRARGGHLKQQYNKRNKMFQDPLPRSIARVSPARVEAKESQ